VSQSVSTVLTIPPPDTIRQYTGLLDELPRSFYV